MKRKLIVALIAICACVLTAGAVSAFADQASESTDIVVPADNNAVTPEAEEATAPEAEEVAAPKAEETVAAESEEPQTTEAAEAKIGTDVYSTLRSAVIAAQTGDTIELLANIDTTSQIEVAGKNITLDLAGKTIEYTGESTLSSGVLLVHNGAGLTINDTVGGGAIKAGTNAYAAVMLTKAGDDATNAAKLIVNGGTLLGYYYGISGNGSRSNTEITINGGTIGGTCTNDNLGIYHPQVGTLTINGGTIFGYSSAVELRSGILKITGGYLRSIAMTYSCVANGSGNTTTGAAIAIAQHTTKNDISVVNISGGSFVGFRAFSEDDPQVNNPTNVSINITGGVFQSNDKVYAKDCAKFIKGGTYNTNPTSFKADDAIVAVQGSGSFKVFIPEAKSLTSGTYTTEPTVQQLATGYVAKQDAGIGYWTVGKAGEIQVEDSVDISFKGSLDSTVAILAAAETGKFEVAGVGDALRSAAKESILSQAGVEPQATDIVNIDVTTRILLTSADTETGAISFTLEPVANVFVNGAKVGTEVAVPNSYLNQDKTIKVVLPVVIVENPVQVIHKSTNFAPEAFNKGTAASYENKTFSFDADAKTVALYITHFSTVDIVATAQYGNVSFDANEGAGEMLPQSVLLNVASELKANAFSREGYSFVGWNTDKDGKGDAYADGAEITLDADVTLYAQWKADAKPEPTPAPVVPKTGDNLLAFFARIFG